MLKLMTTVAVSALLCGVAAAKPAAELRVFDGVQWVAMAPGQSYESIMANAMMTGGSPYAGSGGATAPTTMANNAMSSAAPSSPSATGDLGPSASSTTMAENDVAIGTSGAAPMRADNAATQGDDLLDVMKQNGQFTTFAKAAEAAGFNPVLEGAQTLTVFAPTDAAFAALPSGELESLMEPENREQLVALLRRHVLGAAVTTDQLAGRTVRATTASGEAVTIDARQGVLVNDATVVVADLRASNGVVHGVDKVLTPLSTSATGQS